MLTRRDPPEGRRGRDQDGSSRSRAPLRLVVRFQPLRDLPVDVEIGSADEGPCMRGQRTAPAAPAGPSGVRQPIASSASQNTASPCSKMSCGPWTTTPPGEKTILPTSWNSSPRPG